MSFTVEQLSDLKKAFATGALSVKHGDTTTEFRSLTDMKKLITALENEISQTGRSKKSFLGGKAYRPVLKDF